MRQNLTVEQSMARTLDIIRHPPGRINLNDLTRSQRREWRRENTIGKVPAFIIGLVLFGIILGFIGIFKTPVEPAVAYTRPPKPKMVQSVKAPIAERVVRQQPAESTTVPEFSDDEVQELKQLLEEKSDGDY